MMGRAASAPASEATDPSAEFCISKQITRALLLCTSCLLLFLKLLQIIKDALKACLIIYHCRHGPPIQAASRSSYQLSNSLIHFGYFVMYVLRDVFESNMQNGQQDHSPVIHV
jgi:hypothetical protein